MAARTSRRARLAVLARRHWLALALLGAGIVLRLVTLLAYRPALFTITDSEWYLDRAADLEASTLRPVGYPAFLRLLPLELSVLVVPIVQHVLGLLTAGLLYAVLLRLGVRPWLAALASAPALLDAYVLNLEQQVLAETPFDLLLVGAAVVLLWRRPLGVPAAALAGLLLAAAALVRPIGAVILVPVLIAVLLMPARRRRLWTALALVAVFALPLATYATWFHSENSRFALSQSGRFTYGRVVQFVECDEVDPPPVEQPLCPRAPVGERLSTQELMWSAASPVNRVDPPPGKTRDDLAGSFARRTIRGQPLDYAGAVALDLLRGFAPTKTTGETDFPPDPWKFQPEAVAFFRGRPCLPEAATPEREAACAWRARRTHEALAAYGDDGPQAAEGLASVLRGYQAFGYVPGPVLAALVVLVVAALAGVGRARSSGLRVPVFLFAGLGVALVIGSAAVSTFSWRYQLPVLFLLPPAAALAATALWRPPSARDERPQTPE